MIMMRHAIRYFLPSMLALTLGTSALAQTVFDFQVMDATSGFGDNIQTVDGLTLTQTFSSYADRPVNDFLFANSLGGTLNTTGTIAAGGNPVEFILNSIDIANHPTSPGFSIAGFDTANQEVYNFTFPATSPNADEFMTIDMIAEVGSIPILGYTITNTFGAPDFASFDNVTITAIPEPSTLGGFGLLALLAIGRRWFA